MADFTISGDMTISGQKEAEKAVRDLEKAVKASTDHINTILQGMGANAEASGKKMSKGMERAIVTLATAQTRLKQAETKLTGIQEGAAGRLMQSEVVGDKKIGLSVQKGKNAADTITGYKSLTEEKEKSNKRVIAFRNEERIKTNIVIDENKKRSQALSAAVRNEQSLFKAITRRSLGGSPEVQGIVQNILKGQGSINNRQSMLASGMTIEQAVHQQLVEALGPMSAGFLSGSGKRTATFGAKPQVSAAGGGRGGGGIGGIFRRLLGGGGGGIGGSLISGLAAGAGIGVGGYALANIAGGVIEDTKLATAYERQMVAARNLAGSQSQLNKLLEVYNKASGGAVSKTDQLQAVTRLLATGFAKSAAEVEKFTRGSRGASIALGRPQDEVTQDIQLAVSNTSVKRLDQIGLGIKEVNDRIEQLRKTNKDWRREEAFGEAVLGLLDEKYGKLSSTLEGQATGVEKLAKSWEDLNLAIGKSSKGSVGAFFGAIGSGLDQISKTIEKQEAQGRRAALVNHEGIIQASGNQSADQYAFKNPRGAATQGFFTNEAMFGIKGPRGLTDDNIDAIISSAEGERGRTAARARRRLGIEAPRFKENQYPVVKQGQQDILALEKDFNNRREDEVRSYNQSIASMEKSYQKTMLREQEDFTRQRARGLRDYEKQIVDIMRDAQDRDTEIRDDLSKRLAEINEDGNKRIAKSEESFREQEEKADKQHRLSMLKAAGQLDAIALLEARQQYKEDKAERRKQHKEDIEDAKEALAEQIKDAEEAAQERIDDAKKADEKRLADMASNRKQQLQDEDEDRAISLARAKEDHDDELAEAARVHDEKMKQIQTEYDDRKRELTDALEENLVAVGIYVKGYQEKLEERDKEMEKWFDKYLAKIEKFNDMENRTPLGENAAKNSPSIPQFASGGYVNRTGLAFLHGGEYVMPRSAVAAAMNNNYGNNKSVQVHPGAFQVYTTPGMEMAVGQQIEDILVRILEAA